VVKKEKDIRWPLTNGKNVCEKIDIKRSKRSVSGLSSNILNLKILRSLGLLYYYIMCGGYILTQINIVKW
jgi:hypothetical protein